MNMIEAMSYVAEESKKYNMSFEELDDAIYYLMKDHYKEKPPTFWEYLENPIYVPGANEQLYPIWRDTLKKIYPSIFFNPYYLILLYACTSSGKSFILTLIAGYELAKLLCLKNASIFIIRKPVDLCPYF